MRKIQGSFGTVSTIGILMLCALAQQGLKKDETGSPSGEPAGAARPATVAPGGLEWKDLMASLHAGHPDTPLVPRLECAAHFPVVPAIGLEGIPVIPETAVLQFRDLELPQRDGTEPELPGAPVGLGLFGGRSETLDGAARRNFRVS